MKRRHVGYSYRERNYLTELFEDDRDAGCLLSLLYCQV